MDRPARITDNRYRYDAFSDGKRLPCRGKSRLPVMGWNSWNAYGSGNTEALTKAMAEKLVELGLDQLGYRYVVLDDGCYKPERVDGKLVSEEVKFPSGFRHMSDFIHAKGLLFGMYNDIGSKLCSGASVGTHGYEKEDAALYKEWDIDFIKVDNCYYMWDNATFSDPENAKYVFAPNIRSAVIRGDALKEDITVSSDEGELTGTRASRKDGYITYLGSYDGTSPERTPIGLQSSEWVICVDVPSDGNYRIAVLYASGKEEGVGQWLQIRSEEDTTGVLSYDDFLPETSTPTDFVWSKDIPIRLHAGKNTIRLMNHRRQENTLTSYATILEALREVMPEKDIVFSICEWGKTMPSDWGYKVGDSWRILNDITFDVGSAEGDPGTGKWEDPYTNSITSQYNKCVIMDEFAGLDKGWNDPDMMMIGMNGLTDAMNRTHMSMWCMMNSPLMLGLDLRKVEKDDAIYRIIANKDLIAIDQDPLGIQAKRIWTTYDCSDPSKEYIRDNHRVDVLAKPLSGGRIALSVYNLSGEIAEEDIHIGLDLVSEKLGSAFPEELRDAKTLLERNVWTGEESVVERGDLLGKLLVLDPHGNITLIIGKAG